MNNGFSNSMISINASPCLIQHFTIGVNSTVYCLRLPSETMFLCRWHWRRCAILKHDFIHLCNRARPSRNWIYTNWYVGRWLKLPVAEFCEAAGIRISNKNIAHSIVGGQNNGGCHLKINHRLVLDISRLILVPSSCDLCSPPHPSPVRKTLFYDE